LPPSSAPSAAAAAGDRGGEESFDGAFAAFGLAAEREFAVDDGAAEAAFEAVAMFDGIPQRGAALGRAARLHAPSCATAATVMSERIIATPAR
jgi:hypothetical protein